MPGLDRTGPEGMGPMTGGARGLCNPHGVRTGYAGYGFGFRGTSPAWPYVGRGRGGLPRCWYPGVSGRWPAHAMQPAPGEELDFLKEQSSAMKREMEVIERRIQELEKKE
jgi:hypothetical protein